ncbi:NepR family anti-sigma factor [Croceicoccus naphthovorans]|uniref:NepR family anti-sigma factor n=1 Tax=Croceicoccus naphthovorans TaxID=1348774 RepID=UPI00288A8E70|nr:NepR family anti-sigma factor [Croceicoccus naphthovorans]
MKGKTNDTHPPKKSGKRPDWAAGLRQLYDSVVEEPLPDSFDDLLSKFDSDD